MDKELEEDKAEEENKVVSMSTAWTLDHSYKYSKECIAMSRENHVQNVLCPFPL